MSSETPHSPLLHCSNPVPDSSIFHAMEVFQPHANHTRKLHCMTMFLSTPSTTVHVAHYIPIHRSPHMSESSCSSATTSRIFPLHLLLSFYCSSPVLHRYCLLLHLATAISTKSSSHAHPWFPTSDVAPPSTITAAHFFLAHLHVSNSAASLNLAPDSYMDFTVFIYAMKKRGFIYILLALVSFLE